MEGRTIVRPDPDRNATRPLSLSPFNGGPDNRPARHSPPAGTPASSWTLQWRAGQSSGQTFVPTGRNRLYGLPSMEGRTIVRPDLYTPRARCQTVPTFNGGPDNRPARPNWSNRNRRSPPSLQWRAGQSSGQTGCISLSHASTWALQWRAGQSSGQTQRVSARPSAKR